MSEITSSWLHVTISPLVGVVIGGLISWFTALGLERSRSKRDRQEKLATLEREAIAAALEWIEPMRNAQIQASSLVAAAIHGNFDHEAFLQKYPYLLGELTKRDLTGAQRAVLPEGIYSRGHTIVRELDELRLLGIEHGQRTQMMNQPLSGFSETSAKLDELDSRIESLETDLRSSFRSSFD